MGNASVILELIIDGLILSLCLFNYKIMRNLFTRIDKWTKLCGIYLRESINGQNYAELIYANNEQARIHFPNTHVGFIITGFLTERGRGRKKTTL